MKPVFRLTSTVMLLLTASVVHAHPGHVHGPGPAHGFSWMDIVLFLVASVALPAVAFLVAHWRSRRR